MREVPLLNSDLVAIVDDDDFELVSQQNWYLHRSIGRVRKPYAQGKIKVDGQWTSVLMHRFILGPDHPRVDHRDGNGLDNRRANLRPCTQAQNCWNRGPQRGRKYKGVCWLKRPGKWIAQIRCNGRHEYLGRFGDEIDAARAYDRRAKELHGEFSRLNFPECGS